MAAFFSMPARWRPASVWLLYAVGFAPAAWHFYLGATGQTSGNAIKVFEHILGVWALRFLIATLAITPLRDLFGLNLMRYRRALGLLAFWYAAMHFLTYMVLDQNLNFEEIVRDISERLFITIGMTCLVLLLPLAVTSNNASIRRLGVHWRRLHMLVYPIVLGGALHYVMAVKVITFEPFLYLILAILVVAYRPLRPTVRAWRKRRLAAWH